MRTHAVGQEGVQGQQGGATRGGEGELPSIFVLGCEACGTGGVAARSHLYLPYISPTSPLLYLPYISVLGCEACGTGRSARRDRTLPYP